MRVNVRGYGFSVRLTRGVFSYTIRCPRKSWGYMYIWRP